VADATVIRHVQEHSTKHAQEIADGLVGLAIQKQSVDNITCVVIKVKS
jgi:serine/threonine protein phosphatase PrpC